MKHDMIDDIPGILICAYNAANENMMLYIPLTEFI